MAYATLADLTARFPRDLTSAEQEQAPTLLDDASFVLSVKAPGLQQAIDGGDETVTQAALLLTVTVVKRALQAQANQQANTPAVDQVSQTWGPFSQSVSYRSADAGLYLYDSELRSLLGLLRDDMAEAVAMRSAGL